MQKRRSENLCVLVDVDLLVHGFEGEKGLGIWKGKSDLSLCNTEGDLTIGDGGGDRCGDDELQDDEENDGAARWRENEPVIGTLNPKLVVKKDKEEEEDWFEWS